MKKKGSFFLAAEVIVAAVLALGSAFFFNACDGAEGKMMACHWAQNVIIVIGAVLALSALIGIVIPNDGFRYGISLTVFLFSLAAALIPSNVINLCMMDTMRCHTVFRPAVIVTASILAVISGVHTLIGIISSRKNR